MLYRLGNLQTGSALLAGLSLHQRSGPDEADSLVFYRCGVMAGPSRLSEIDIADAIPDCRAWDLAKSIKPLLLELGATPPPIKSDAIKELQVSRPRMLNHEHRGFDRVGCALDRSLSPRNETATIPAVTGSSVVAMAHGTAMGGWITVVQ